MNNNQQTTTYRTKLLIVEAIPILSLIVPEIQLREFFDALLSQKCLAFVL